MIPSIDYLTLVVSGSVLLAAAGRDPKGLTAYAFGLVGLGLFLVGTIRAAMQVFGI